MERIIEVFVTLAVLLSVPRVWVLIRSFLCPQNLTTPLRESPEDAFDTLSTKWLFVCESFGVSPQDLPKNNPTFNNAREQLVYAANAVWSPKVIEGVAAQIPGLFSSSAQQAA